MKILDAGDSPLSNADVLDWIQRKRAQHAAEDAQDKQERGVKPAPRPKNFLAALNRHERELTSDNYPYHKNPTAYAGSARQTQLERFALEAESTLQDHLEAEWKETLVGMTPEAIEKEFAPEQEKKCLTEPELLMIYNHAPVCVEMLQPMIENVEERFTAQEQELLVQVIAKTLRPDQNPGLVDR